MSVSVSLEGEHLAVRFPTSDPLFREHLETIKRIPGRTFTKDGGNRWLVPRSQIDRLRAAFPSAWFSPEIFEADTEWKTLKDLPDAEQPPDIYANLWPYQRVGVQLLRHHKTAFLFDEMRLGKTRQAIGWANYWREKLQKPVLVVCPSPVKSVYESEIKLCRPDDSVFVVEGLAGDFAPPGTQWVTLNWELLSVNKQRKAKLAESDLEARIDQIKKFGFGAIIYSEAHRAKSGAGSLRGQAAMEIAQFADCRLCETGTPMQKKPLELLPLLRIAGKVLKGEEWQYKLRFCFKGMLRVPDPRYGQPGHKRYREVHDFSGANHLDELWKMIEPYTVARKKADVIKDLPPFAYSYPLVEISNREEYRKTERDMFKLAEGLEDDDLNGEERLKLMGQVLAKRQELVMVAAKGKVNAAADLMSDYEEAGKKLVIFSEFLDPLYTLKMMFPTKSLLLTGDVQGQARTELIQKFQSNPDILFALCSRKAYGEGIELNAADTVLFINLPWGPEDWRQARDRVSVSARTLEAPTACHCINMLADRTIDAAIVSLIYEKAGVVNETFGQRILDEAARFKHMLELLQGKRLVHENAY